MNADTNSETRKGQSIELKFTIVSMFTVVFWIKVASIDA